MHVVKSLQFVAEEISEQIRVQSIQHEQSQQEYASLIKEVSDKFKKSNLKQQLSNLLDIMKALLKQFDKSLIIEDCEGINSQYKAKIEWLSKQAKKIKQGDKQCIEVIQKKEEIIDTINTIQKEKVLVEYTKQELYKISKCDLNFQFYQTPQEQDTMKQRLLMSFIELIREKNEPLASLLVPSRLREQLNNVSQEIENQMQKQSSMFSSACMTPLKQQDMNSYIGSQQQNQNLNKFSLQQTQLSQAHEDFINSLCDYNQDYYVSSGSDYCVNVWSKSTFTLVKEIRLPGEVVCMCRVADDQILIGMINGTLGMINLNSMDITKILDRAHTGTVVSCISLKKLKLEYAVTQDDSREIKVWKVSDLSVPIIKMLGRSYNPIWYVQSLIELQVDKSQYPIILSACGSEPSAIQYRIDIGRREIEAIKTSATKGIPTALISISPDYYAVSSTSEIEFYDQSSGLNTFTIQTQPQQSNQMFETIFTMTLIPNSSQDPTKKLLAASGANKILYIYKVDLLLKCQSIQLYKLDTNHSSTISSVISVRGVDPNEIYLISGSIDKQIGIYKIFNNLDIEQENSSLSESALKMRKYDPKDIKQLQSDKNNFQFLNQYLQDQNQVRDKNNPACCIIF